MRVVPRQMAIVICRESLSFFFVDMRVAAERERADKLLVWRRLSAISRLYKQDLKKKNRERQGRYSVFA